MEITKADIERVTGQDLTAGEPEMAGRSGGGGGSEERGYGAGFGGLANLVKVRQWLNQTWTLLQNVTSPILDRTMLHSFPTFAHSILLAIHHSNLDHTEYWPIIQVFIFDHLDEDLQKVAFEARPEGLDSPLHMSPSQYLYLLEILLPPLDNAHRRLAYKQLKQEEGETPVDFLIAKQ